MNLGLHNIQVNTASLADGHSIAAYLTDAAGALLTSTTIGATQRLDSNDISSHLDGSAYSAGVDYLMSMGAIDTNGNWVPFTLNASGELPVSATVDFAGDYSEDAPHTDGDTGLFTLLVRQDTLAESTSNDGDYGAFKSNNLGELYVFDTTTHSQLTTANSSLSTIVTNTGNTASNTSTISSTLSALSKAEDAAHSSGDQGIQALGVRKDSQGSNAADGDYTSLLTWSEGSLKVVDIANGSILQQQIAVATTATKLPTTPLANRKTLMIQNAGSASIWVGSATVTNTGATTGIEVPKASFMELEVGPAVDVYGVVASGTQNANILQMA
jgi:hypothetical protein